MAFQYSEHGGYVEVKQIIVELEQEIARLNEARALLSGEGTGRRKRGRPAGKANAPRPAVRKRQLSPEGRKRISEAMTRRWAARRKAKAQKQAKSA
jgi:hypothetical protein